jgi:tetratricopeptide (TPR) repeat protein
VAQRLIDVSVEHDFRQREAQGRMLLGWARCQSTSDEQALAEHQRAFDDFRDTRARVQYSYFLCLLVESYLALGQFAIASDLLDEAQAAADVNDERVWQSEIFKLRGDIARATGELESSERHYTRAVSVSRAQNAKSHELRAAAGLARLWHSQGRAGEARRLLSPVVEWFTEGHDSADFRAASALLDES